MDGGNSTESCQHTWFWILAAHGQLDQERQSKKHAWYCGITTEFCLCNTSFVFANSETEKKKVALFTFQQIHHVLPSLMCLRQVMCPSCFPSLRWKTWVELLNWIQKGTKLHVQLLVCISLQLSTPQWDTVLDLTTLTYQPTTKSSEQPGHTKRHVTYAISVENSISSSCTRHA